MLKLDYIVKKTIEVKQRLSSKRYDSLCFRVNDAMGRAAAQGRTKVQVEYPYDSDEDDADILLDRLVKQIQSNGFTVSTNNTYETTFIEIDWKYPCDQYKGDMDNKRGQRQ